MLLWYVGEDDRVLQVVANKLTTKLWKIDDFGIVTDGHDLFRNRSGALRHLRNKHSRPTYVPYLRIVSGQAA